MNTQNSRIQHDKLISAFLSIEDARIDNDFWVEGVQGVLQVENALTGAAATEEILFAVVSLRGLKSRVFHHDPENSWGDDHADIKLKLRLDGFEYDRVDTEEFEPWTSVKAFKNSRCESFWEFLFSLLFPSGVRAFEKSVTEKSATAYKHWLSLQENHEKAGDYDPQPYEQLARALRNDGKYEAAEYITLEKLALERQLVKRSGARLFMRFMEQLDYGLFPSKSVCWFLFIWLFGASFRSYRKLQMHRCFIHFIHKLTMRLAASGVDVFDDSLILVRHSIAASTLTLTDKDTTDTNKTDTDKTDDMDKTEGYPAVG